MFPVSGGKAGDTAVCLPEQGLSLDFTQRRTNLLKKLVKFWLSLLLTRVNG